MLETRIDFKNEAQCSHENRTNSLVRLPEGERAAKPCSLDVFPFGFLIILPRLSTALPNKSALTSILSGSAHRQHILTSYVDSKTLI